MPTQTSHRRPVVVSSPRRQFFSEFLKNPTGMAAVAPSSVHLAREMVRGLDVESFKTIIEYGPGTGVFTEQIVKRLPRGWLTSEGGQGRFLSIEFNPRMADIVRAHFPTVGVHTDSAANVEAICRKEGIEPGTVDAVISGLGFANLPPDLSREILEATHRVLKPGGEFRTFTYHVSLVRRQAWAFRNEAMRVFGSLKTSRGVWSNIPSAFVYHCIK